MKRGFLLPKGCKDLTDAAKLQPLKPVKPHREPSKEELQSKIRFLKDYYAAFSTLNIPSFLPFFREPSLHLWPQGLIKAFTHAELAKAFVPVVESLRARQVVRSELSVQEGKIESEIFGWVWGVAIRFRADGEELERVDVTYRLEKTDTDWKITTEQIWSPSVAEL